MLKNAMWLPKLRLMMIQQRRKDNIDNYQLCFLATWFKINKENIFGFQGGLSLANQLDEAIKFFQKTQRLWQDKVRDNETSLPFIEFFTYEAIANDIELVDGFEKLLAKELEEVYREYNGIENVGGGELQEGQSPVDGAGGQGKQGS